MMYVLFTVTSCPNTKRDTPLFLSNFLKTLSEHGVGDSIPSQFSSSDCFLSSLVTCCGSLSTGFRPLVTAHLKHSSSSFFMLIRAFLFAMTLGNSMWEDPLRGLSLLRVMSNLTALFNIQPLPFLRYVACNHLLVHGFQIRGLKHGLLLGVERRLLLVRNISGGRFRPHHYPDKAQLNLVLRSLPEEPDHNVPGEI